MELVKTRIVKIGNSQGVRIPKLLLQQVGLINEVEVEAQEGQLVIRPLTHAQQGWEQSFQAMAERRDDQMLDSEPLVLTNWQTNGWV